MIKKKRKANQIDIRLQFDRVRVKLFEVYKNFNIFFIFFSIFCLL